MTWQREEVYWRLVSVVISELQSVKIHSSRMNLFDDYEGMHMRRQRDSNPIEESLKAEESTWAEQPVISYAGDPTDSDPGYEVKSSFVPT